MKILIVGNTLQLGLCKKKLGDEHEYLLESTHDGAQKYLAGKDLVFDFVITEHPDQVNMYLGFPNLTVFLNSVTTSLLALTTYCDSKFAGNWIGFNGMPTFFERTLWEITALDHSHAETMMQKMGLDYQLIDDCVGMVTPRVICMIINEAYFTFQEGTATREDIDLAMKLGTNYPYGPFEWCERIGVRNVYELLEAVHDDTKDERYKICPLLRKEYLLTVE